MTVGVEDPSIGDRIKAKVLLMVACASPRVHLVSFPWNPTLPIV